MYNVRPTSKFQKDLKRAKKRGYDIDLLTLLKSWQRVNRCQRRTKIMIFLGIMLGAENATLPRIGF